MLLGWTLAHVSVPQPFSYVFQFFLGGVPIPYLAIWLWAPQTFPALKLALNMARYEVIVPKDIMKWTWPSHRLGMLQFEGREWRSATYVCILLQYVILVDLHFFVRRLLNPRQIESKSCTTFCVSVWAVHRSAGVPDNIIQEATLASEQRRAIEHLKASPLGLRRGWFIDPYHSSGAARYDHSITYPPNSQQWKRWILGVGWDGCELRVWLRLWADKFKPQWILPNEHALNMEHIFICVCIVCMACICIYRIIISINPILGMGTSMFPPFWWWRLP